MGSGDRFRITWIRGFGGFGFFIDNFPHQISVVIALFKVSIYIGLGKAYDQ